MYNVSIRGQEDSICEEVESMGALERFFSSQSKFNLFISLVIQSGWTVTEQIKKKQPNGSVWNDQY